MSRDSSPPPLSDDSAVGSSSSCLTNNDRPQIAQTQPAPTLIPQQQQQLQQIQQLQQYQQQRQQQQQQQPQSYSQPPPQQYQKQQQQQQQQPQQQSPQPPPPRQQPKAAKVTRPSARDLVVQRDELVLAARLMRQNNCSLILKSIRTNLSCFDDLDVQKFESRTSFLINFISNGINKCTSSILRPVSIRWPDSYDRMVDQLATLDVFLLNTGFREKPVDWMLTRGLINKPNCQQCKEKMVIKYEHNTVMWFCNKTPACSNYFMPIQRPSFFHSYEDVGLDKLLFAVYYWSACIPGEELYRRMNVEPRVLDSIWKKLQNVCRTALDKSYPRHRLTNQLDEGSHQLTEPTRPIDLISIKLNDVFIVCAKHPDSNLVRLGLYIPRVSQYSFADLTASWFAHGATVRVSEDKFLDLTKTRADLKIDLVPRLDMMTQDGRFHRDSAFGYLVSQLSHVLKDFDSSTLTRESLKLVLAELEWRELYGSTPCNAFTNIVDHMAQYGEASDWYSEPSLPVDGEETSQKYSEELDHTLEACQYVWAEKYFYATVDPVDKDGKVISRFTEPPNVDNPPQPDVRLTCHECSLRFDCFDFAIHMIMHVENNRKESERKEYLRRGLIECKHCFKTFKRQDIEMHSRLFSSHYHQVRYGCRICCIRLNDRAGYLQHMRRLHFEHETPYRCPSCKFASSFQRDVFIHFEEEHRHTMILLCPLCLRSFTIAKPELMTDEKMRRLSKLVYNHVAEHYVSSKSFACSNCSLCFLDKDALNAHMKAHHNPLEIKSFPDTKLSPFLVTQDEESYCVKALPNELFISNKRPNLTTTLTQAGPSTSKNVADIIIPEPIVVMRPSKVAKDGSANKDCSSARLIQYMSRMKRADGIIPNRSVILTPNAKPAKCCECFEYITADHFVASIGCKHCKYTTYCPRAATKHKLTKH